MIRIVFNDLPDIESTSILSINGFEVGSKTAKEVAKNYPAFFGIELCRFGEKLVTHSNFGAPKIDLIYTDGITNTTIYGEDEKTQGDEHFFVGGRRPHYPHLTICW